jgi:hypothetical protein
MERLRYSGPATRVCAFNDANISHTSSGSWQTLTFNNESWDTHGFHSIVSNTSRLTVPANMDGLYIITGLVGFAPNATGERGANILLGGATNIGRVIIDNAGGTLGERLPVTRQYYLNATNYVELQAYQSSGGSLNVVYSAEISPYFMMVRIA